MAISNHCLQPKSIVNDGLDLMPIGSNFVPDPECVSAYFNLINSEIIQTPNSFAQEFTNFNVLTEFTVMYLMLNTLHRESVEPFGPLKNFDLHTGLVEIIDKGVDSRRKIPLSFQAIASVNVGQFRGKNESEIAIWNECARLLANAIIYFNSAMLSHLLGHFEATGDEEKVVITRGVSPVAWQNINLSGTYNFTNTDQLPNISEITRPIVVE